MPESYVDRLVARYEEQLQGFGASLPEEFKKSALLLDGVLGESELDQWAETGIRLAGQSLRAWEAATEYFRATPVIHATIGFQGIIAWAQLAANIAEKSSLVAASFIKFTPSVLEYLTLDDLEEWSLQGDRLFRGNWKSGTLSAAYFEHTPALLKFLPLASIEKLVSIIDALTERSYELASTCLESATRIFGELESSDREPFLGFARAVTRASWADTRLYFERGPSLITSISPEHRADFLDLSAKVTSEVGRQAFPLFADAAESLGQLSEDTHAEHILFASNIAIGSPTAAMEYLKIVPFVSNRLTSEQLRRWSAVGEEILTVENNAEGAEAFFRLESTRAENSLQELSSRIELASINTLLRMYAKALTGEQVGIYSVEELVDQNIGWVQESVATTEGSSIYLPPFVATFDEQEANFQSYKVFATHQTGRIEFGSFRYKWNQPGIYTGSTILEREESAQSRREVSADSDEVSPSSALTAMQRYFNVFDERILISGIFTVVEDTRVDAYVSREYGGIRKWLRQLQAHEGNRRPRVENMPLRAAFVENLLRTSLGRPETMRWPTVYREFLESGLAALKIVEQDDATVQDSAEAAAAIFDIAQRIPNVTPAMSDGKFDFDSPSEDMLSIQPAMPSGDGPPLDMQSNDQEIEFENPPQPEFRGDFKPELVQLLARLKQQQEGQVDGEGAPLTKEQLKELLENSVEITIAEWAEGDLDESLGMFLENLEQAATPSGEGKSDDDSKGSDESSGGQGDGEEQELPMEIDWSYYDEWDFRASDYRPRWTRVGQRFHEAEEEPEFYEETLRRHHGLVMETRKQFEMMRPEVFKKIKRVEDGDELDVDLAIEFYIDKKAGIGPTGKVYNKRNKMERDVAVAFLLDMSASTDEEIEKQRQSNSNDDDEDDFDGDPRKYFQWLAARRASQMIEPPKRIIDLEKESAVLIVEALEAIGDSYGIYGFSGYGRDNVEFHIIKDLEEPMGPLVQRRIGKIEPIRSTRMGPAIRHTIHKLNEYDAKVKILIMVSDGRPQDHGYGKDRTEKEYAVHDTKQALLEAKRDGITPFLITVDKEGHDYLQQMCDDIGYEVVDDIESLPRRLPTLYRHLAVE
jgi:hypothetical protein